MEIHRQIQLCKRIQTLKEEYKSISLTGFNKYIKENKNEREIQLHTLAYDDYEEQNYADKVGEENHILGVI